MDLNAVRERINAIDDQIVDLFVERMKASADVDVYKRQVHNNPAKALCDGPQSLTPDQFDDVAKQVFQLRPFACKYDY